MLSMAHQDTKVESKSITKENGEQSATIFGTTPMLVSFVGCLVWAITELPSVALPTGKVLEISFLTM